MNKEKIEKILKGEEVDKVDDPCIWTNYIETKRKLIRQIDPKYEKFCMVSEANWLLRNQAISCDDLGVKVRVGDICYIDFGVAYLNEAGFQHFGLVLSIYQKKAFVIPMTSNQIQCQNAYDSKRNKEGKKHLMKIGVIAGMTRESVLFLNDCKYINSARVIDVKAHICPSDPLFLKIKERVKETLFNQ